MSDGSQIKLVLNINTPDFFQKSSNAPLNKRTLEPTHAVTSPKKPKFTHFGGTKLETSSIGYKLKNNYSPEPDNSFPCINKEASYSSSRSRFHKQIKTDTKTSKKRVGRNVSFNPDAEVFSVAEESKNLSISPSSNLITKKLKDDKKSVKPIASLFSNNPDIPFLQNREGSNKLNTQKLFSAITFNEFDISPNLISTLGKNGFSAMTLVQHRSIPIILEGSDALIKSQTGSGKTLAYTVPIIHKLMTRKPKVERCQGLYAMIVVPTRELAIQTFQWLENLCKSCVWVVPGYLIGGEKKKAEKARLRKGINILVATPGRLSDHIQHTNSLSLSRVQYLVLDEADRILDLGYEKAITSIIHSLNQQNSDGRQTLLLSATLTSAVEKLAGMSLKSPQIIDVTSDDVNVNDGTLSNDHFVTPENLTQHFILVPIKLRLVTLAAFIIDNCKFTDKKKILVFMTTQDMVDYHTTLFNHILSKMGKKSYSVMPNSKRKRMGEVDADNNETELEEESDIHFMKLHGKMSQPERTAVFKSFQSASSGVLLCTDVASRGLDLPGVNWIVQFNPAHEPADYVHRVGRTARAAMTGSAILFVTPAETNYVTMLKDQGVQLKETKMEGVLQTLIHPALNREFERPPSNLEIAATRLQDKFEQALESDEELRNMGVQGYISFVRSYAAIPKKSREYLSFKLLHLGHCAKSFALRDPPSVLGEKGKLIAERATHRPKERRKGNKERSMKGVGLLMGQTACSEFDSGLDDLDRMSKERK